MLPPQTYERYEQLLRLHAYDNVGLQKLNQVKAPHFQRLYSDLQSEKGLSGTTILQLHRILHKAFKTACEWQLITKNPLEHVKPPKKEEKEVIVLTEEQAGVMLKYAQEEGPFWFYVLLALAVIGGLRRGELLALRWEDVNFEKSTVSINQNIQRVKGEGVSFKSPKTKNSKRTIALPSDAMELLRQQKISQNKQRLNTGDLWEDNDLVFAGSFGKPMSPDYISEKFKNLLSITGCPRLHCMGLGIPPPVS